MVRPRMMPTRDWQRRAHIFYGGWMDKHKCRSFTAWATRKIRFSMKTRRRGKFVMELRMIPIGEGMKPTNDRNEALPRTTNKAREKMKSRIEGKTEKKSRQNWDKQGGKGNVNDPMKIHQHEHTRMLGRCSGCFSLMYFHMTFEFRSIIQIENGNFSSLSQNSSPKLN